MIQNDFLAARYCERQQVTPGDQILAYRESLSEEWADSRQRPCYVRLIARCCSSSIQAR